MEWSVYSPSVYSLSLALSELLRRESTLTAKVGETTEYLAQLREDIRVTSIDNAHLSRFGELQCCCVVSEDPPVAVRRMKDGQMSLGLEPVIKDLS